MNTAPIYVVVASDDLNGKFLAQELLRNPDRKPNPIVFETNVTGATLGQANLRAASIEKQGGYGPTRVGRVVFEDEPGFAVEGAQP